MGRTGALHGRRPSHPGAGRHVLTVRRTKGTITDHTPCRLGLWGVFDVEDYGQAVYAEVVRAELARRLPGAEIHVFAPYGPERPSRSDRGEPAEALGTWSPAAVAALADRLDLVVVGGEGLAESAHDLANRYGIDVAEVEERKFGRFLTEGLGPAREVPVRWHATDVGAEAALRRAGVAGPIEVSSHPAVLSPRLSPVSVLRKRLEYLRLMGWYPREGGALIVEVDRSAADVAGLAPSVLRILDDHPALSLVVAEHDVAACRLTDEVTCAGRPVHRLPPTVSREDFAAVLSAADGYIGASAAAYLTACAYGTPCVMFEPGATSQFTADPGRLVRDPTALGDAFSRAIKAQPDEQLLRGRQADVDTWLDRIAEGAVAAATSRGAAGDVAGATHAGLEAELRALRLAHRVRTERGNAERVVLADRVGSAEAELALLRAEVQRLRLRADTEAAARVAAEAEVAALRATRTFRWTAAARGLYRRTRGGR